MTIKFLPHTADIKFQASGATLEKAFEESAKALKQTITKLKIQDKQERKISIKAKDNEALLYNFLEEFLFLLDAEDFLLNKIIKLEIHSPDNKDSTKGGTSRRRDLGGHLFKLVAQVSGDKASNYKISNEVKAITYNQMFVKKSKDKFICQVVLDV